MCGITGFWLKTSWAEATAREALVVMSTAIAHRGPDDSDSYFEVATGLGLAHRRLSIVDLSPEGRQPMVSASGRYVIVFNGEVYNFRDLLAELEASGAAPAWRGESDTEVMLAAIEAWGLDAALGRFVGMFAFALWDRSERCLTLVRDRLGVKPLFYAPLREGFVFGSELSTILAFPGFERRVDDASLYEFLQSGHVPAPRGIYEGTYKLPPGCLLRLPFAGGAPVIESYWDARERCRPAPTTFAPRDEPALLEELDALLRSSVALRMIADVPLGAFLSGGIDSSLVVALMQAQSTRPMRTFSIGSDRAEYDEGQAAARVAAHLGTDHTPFMVTAEDAQAVVPGLGALFDEPFADSSQIPTLLVSRLARAEVTVALTGDGGDEGFGGYNRHVWGPRAWRALRLLPTSARGRLRRGLLALPPAGYDALARLVPAGARPRLAGAKVHKLLGVMGARSSADFYRALCAQWLRPEDVLARPLRADSPFPSVDTGDLATDMMLLDTLTYLPDDVLTKVDRATMAVALEARSPLLDHRVLELAATLPMSMKIRNGVGKWALRELLHRYVPKHLVDRPKMGFAVPIGAWLRGPLKEWASDLLLGDVRRSAPYFQEAVVRNTWEEHLSGRQDHASKLWTLLMFRAWLTGPHGASP
jgi:asparagine synthase (glutamine-hydrolysing)